MVRILIACEESQTVCTAFRDLGYEAYSCDVCPTSGNHPEWHLQQDVIPLLKEDWSLIIAFPPCTHLAVSGARWFPEKRKDGRQQQGIDFFMEFVNCDCPKIAIENPVGIMSTVWRKPDQIIQPWMFGDPYEKRTCLWLKGLPKLKTTNIVKPPPRKKYPSGATMPAWYADIGGRKGHGRLRSKTFPGIAKAMAITWSYFLCENSCRKIIYQQGTNERGKTWQRQKIF